MLADKLKEITRLLNSFPQTGTNKQLLLDTYAQQLDGLSTDAVRRSVARFLAGEVEGQSMTFAPSVPEFVRQAKTAQEAIDLASRPRLPKPEYRRGPLAPWEFRRNKLLAEYDHRTVLFTDVNNERWRSLSAAGQVPVGAVWVAALATVYGPDPAARKQAA